MISSMRKRNSNDWNVNQQTWKTKRLEKIWFFFCIYKWENIYELSQVASRQVNCNPFTIGDTYMRFEKSLDVYIYACEVHNSCVYLIRTSFGFKLLSLTKFKFKSAEFLPLKKGNAISKGLKGCISTQHTS
jgi:hypothetical protein